MNKELVEMEINEFSGDKYSDLVTAQKLALHSFAESLEPIIRDLIEKGELVVLNGRIIPKPEKGIFFVNVAKDVILG